MLKFFLQIKINENMLFECSKNKLKKESKSKLGSIKKLCVLKQKGLIILNENINIRNIDFNIYILEYKKQFSDILVLKYNVGYIFILLDSKSKFILFSRIDGKFEKYKGEYLIKKDTKSLELYNDYFKCLINLNNQTTISEFFEDKYNLKKSFVYKVESSASLVDLKHHHKIDISTYGYFVFRKTY